MLLVLLLLTLCLPVVDCPWWLPRPGMWTCRGAGTRPRTVAPCRTHPVLVAVVKAAVPAPAAPPLGRPQDPDPHAGRRVSIPPQPTRAVRGDGPGSSLGEWCSPGNGKGPHAVVGGWRFDRGLSRRGTTAPPRTGCDRHGDRGAPLPPPGESRGQGGSQGVAAACLESGRGGVCTNPWHERARAYPTGPDARHGGGAYQGPLPACSGPPATTDQGLGASLRGRGGDAPDHPGALLDTPGAGGGGKGGGTSPGDPPPPLGWPHFPDPRPGGGVSIRPQTTRAPRVEAMALGPLRRRGPARAVARGPTLQWGVGGTTRGTAAAALRLPLAPGLAGTAARGSSPRPPPP